jgi:hypothetical protein
MGIGIAGASAERGGGREVGPAERAEIRSKAVMAVRFVRGARCAVRASFTPIGGSRQGLMPAIPVRGLLVGAGGVLHPSLSGMEIRD